MKLKNEKEIEEVAVNAFNKVVCSEWMKWQDEVTKEGLRLLAIDIARSIQQDTLASASEGFEEWLSIQNIDSPSQKYRTDLEREFCIGFGKGYREAAKDAWQAARLSSIKSNSSEIPNSSKEAK